MKMRVGVGMMILCAVFSGSSMASGSKKFLTLEDAAVAQAKKWQETGTAKPIMSDDGKIVFPFGQYLPTLTCAPLRACDIELEAGEIVTGKPLAGDNVRWKVSKAESGSGDKRITHVVVKPIDINLDTNLIITTDRRTYHIRLFSSANERDYLNRVGFYYPQDIAEEWDESARLAEKETKAKEKLVVTELPTLSVDKLDFSYKVEGDKATRFVPTRVFNDGTHVFLQMPEEVRSAEAPILILLDENDKPQIVNYRVKDAYYIVDKLFDKAMLVVGTDGSESKVLVSWTKGQRKGWFW